MKSEKKPGIKTVFTRIALILLLVPPVIFFTPSCSEEKTAEKAPEGMHLLDLSPYGKPFSIYVPDTVRSKLTVSEQPSGSLDIRSGNNFAISIFEQFSDIELRKQDIRADEVNRFKKFSKDGPDGIMWQSEITQPEFHFLINRKIGNSEYSFEDTRDPELGTFGEEAIMKMYDSSKNIRETNQANQS